MAVFREKVIEWDGLEYTFTPDMRLLRAIESDGTSIMHVAHSVAIGKPQAAIMARVVAMVMQAAGAKLTEDDVYQGIMTDGGQAMALYGRVMEAISPEEPKDKKKPEPPQT